MTMPAPFRPIKVMNSPIPAVMAYFRLAGTSLTSFSLKLHRDSKTNTIPSAKTAAKAIFQGSVTPFAARSPHTVKAK